MEANYGTRKHDYWTDSSYFELRSSSFNGKNFGKKQFLDLDTSASNTTELHCYKFAPLSSISGSFNAFFWISNLVGEALKSIFCFYFGAEVKFGASVGVGRAFPRFRPVDPPTNDTRRYEAKEASPLGELSSETDVFPGSRSVTSPR